MFYNLNFLFAYGGDELPDLPIARVHEENNKCLCIEDCYWEDHIVDNSSSWKIGVGRTDSGFHWSFGWKHRSGGCSGPVFIREIPAPDFKSARLAAIDELLVRLSVSYNNSSNCLDRIAQSVRNLA
jgi:hypothetical protein